jgi:hypothetical protein
MSFPQDQCSSPAKVPAARLPFLLPPGRREELGSLHVVLVGLDTPSENKFYRLLMVVIKESFSHLWIRIQDRCFMKIFRNPKMPILHIKIEQDQDLDPGQNIKEFLAISAAAIRPNHKIQEARPTWH